MIMGDRQTAAFRLIAFDTVRQPNPSCDRDCWPFDQKVHDPCGKNAHCQADGEGEIRCGSLKGGPKLNSAGWDRLLEAILQARIPIPASKLKPK
jgi:hypothetical protein